MSVAGGVELTPSRWLFGMRPGVCRAFELVRLPVYMGSHRKPTVCRRPWTP